MKHKHNDGVFSAVCMAVWAHPFLSVATILCVAASVAATLVPPLLLARVIDRLTGGTSVPFTAALLYFGSLALEGVLSSAQETLLVIFGQKMTHALRSEMSQKLTRLPAGTLVAQNPGEVAARFSGDVDTVEALFTSGIISMIADACRILSILAVIAVKNTGLALILLAVLPLLTWFTRHVQKQMLSAQLNNRRAVAAVSGQVPETLHNIRTIHALGLEDYMAQKYDRRIGESYAAVERTNFYDAIYSPVVLLLNAAVVGIVMLLSASGKSEILALFGMSVGTSVAVINYITRIFSPIESLGMEMQTIQSERRRAGHADRPNRCRKKHRVSPFARPVPAGIRYTDHRRRGRFGDHRPGTARVHRLRGAAFFPRAGHRSGSDHAGRPAHYRRNGGKRGRPRRNRRRNPCTAGRLPHRVYGRAVFAGRMAIAVHRAGSGGKSGRAAAG